MVDPTPEELMRAQGHFMVVLSSLLEGRGVVAAGELGKLLQAYSDVSRSPNRARARA